MKDPDLRRCSRAARGMWIDMICLMFEAECRGVLATGNVPWTDREISGAVGGDIAEGCELIAELLRTGVASRSSSGAVVCRRLVRDEEIRRVRAEVGSKGGSKTQANRQAKPKQIHEDEDEEEGDSSKGNGDARGKGDTGPPGFARFWDTWPKSPRRTARPQCLEKWVKRGLEAKADLIVSAVEAHKLRHPDWLKPNGEFIPAPVVWLNQERWNAPLPDAPVTGSEILKQRLAEVEARKK